MLPVKTLALTADPECDGQSRVIAFACLDCRPYAAHNTTGYYLSCYNQGHPAGSTFATRGNIERRTMKTRNTRALQSAHRALGERIRELRQAKGLSQAAFAQMCDIGPRYIARIEQGESN